MTRGDVPPASRRERRAQARLEQPAAARHRATRKSVRPVWQSPVVLVTAAAVLITIAVIAFSRPPQTTTGAELIKPPTAYPAALVDGEALGAKDAPIVLQVYSDYQCPACRQFTTLQLPRLLTEFVLPGTLRIEARDIDILGTGNPSESLELAAGASCAAAQGRYWEFHDYVFWNQGRENQGDHDTAFITRVADAAGVDRVAWDACFARPDARTPIKTGTSTALGLGINSTPTLVVNGQRFAGVPDYDQLAALIRQLASSAAPSAS
ncbi:MAG: thioredoxin domain-containing protein [Chloroflexota bacterium]